MRPRHPTSHGPGDGPSTVRRRTRRRVIIDGPSSTGHRRSGGPEHGPRDECVHVTRRRASKGAASQAGLGVPGPDIKATGDGVANVPETASAAVDGGEAGPDASGRPLSMAFGTIPSESLETALETGPLDGLSRRLFKTVLRNGPSGATARPTVGRCTPRTSPRASLGRFGRRASRRNGTTTSSKCSSLRRRSRHSQLPQATAGGAAALCCRRMRRSRLMLQPQSGHLRLLPLLAAQLPHAVAVDCACRRMRRSRLLLPLLAVQPLQEAQPPHAAAAGVAPFFCRCLRSAAAGGAAALCCRRWRRSRLIQPPQSTQPPFAASGGAAAAVGTTAFCRCWLRSRLMRRSRLLLPLLVVQLSQAAQPPHASAAGGAAAFCRCWRRSRLMLPPQASQPPYASDAGGAAAFYRCWRRSRRLRRNRLMLPP
ncbi:hypothetical protein M885DRAFT_194860 [Pelagophyceae sp. CCMP2097]|nr:hypothetical protein M885DRAFT_194860 [Pelagophyceae sp. CCMP2097]